MGRRQIFVYVKGSYLNLYFHIFNLQVQTVFVDGLPATWDEDRVRGLLKTYGEIVKIELARNMPSAKRKDFGFVTFDTHDAAVTCAKSINNAELGEGGNKVCFMAVYTISLLILMKYISSLHNCKLKLIF